MDGSLFHHGPDAPRPPYVIVVGNEKGGTGKSTTAVHLIVALLRAGYAVGSIDLDARQSTLTRYFANRQQFAADAGVDLPMPRHHHIERSQATTRAAAEAEERKRLRAACEDLIGCHFIVIDTPGSDAFSSRLAHENADTLLTPLNDSFLDIDIIAHIDRERREVVAPSAYTKMVWEQNNRRVMAGRPPIDWVVMRNRLTHIEARNKREIAGLMERLARRIGFRLAPGFGERVIYRELFLKGLTVLDLAEEVPGAAPNPSRTAARREIAALLETIGLSESHDAVPA
ncbi:MAG: ATPase [Alphaproteobacteria bacterium]|nr:MAG: ATPase [Alphaproteobacteria bacterium]